MKGVKLCLSLLAFSVLSSIGLLVSYSTDVSAQSAYDSVINDYSEPKGFDDTLFQGQGTGIRDFTYRGLVDYLSGVSPTVNSNPASYDGNCTLTGSESWVAGAIEQGQFIGFENRNTELYPLTNQNLYVYRNINDAQLSDIVFNSNSTKTGGFTQIDQTVDNSNIIIINFQAFEDSLRVNCFVGVSINNSMIIGNSTNGVFTYLNYLKHFNVIYPPDYVGSGLPTFPSFGIPSNEAQPDIYMTSLQNFKAEFSDRNFFTYDGLPFTCGEFSPSISIEIWTEHGTAEEIKLADMTTSASSVFNYTFPTANKTRDYRIVAYYSCPEFTFSNVQFYDFQIDRNGNLVGELPCSAELFCSLNFPTYGLTQVVLAPLAFLAEIPTMTCTPLTLPMPNGISNLSLPCMTPIYQQNFGGILLLFQTIITGLFAYYVSLRIFGNIKELANPRDDQVETVRL